MQSNKAVFKQAVGMNVNRKRSLSDKLDFRNPLVMNHFRGGKLLGSYNFFNDITNVGKNNIFDVFFNSGTQTAAASWVLSLINESGFSAVAPTDTMASHGGWTEWTSYTQSTRVAWGSGAASGQSVTNATPATFNINAAGTLKGVFVTTVNTKAGTTGILWATALFGADVPVSISDELKITYTVSA